MIWTDRGRKERAVQGSAHPVADAAVTVVGAQPRDQAVEGDGLRRVATVAARAFAVRPPGGGSPDGEAVLLLLDGAVGAGDEEEEHGGNPEEGHALAELSTYAAGCVFTYVYSRGASATAERSLQWMPRPHKRVNI